MLRHLHGHRDLGVHFGMITDEIAGLIEGPGQSPVREGVDPGLAVTGLLLGFRVLTGRAAVDKSIQLCDTRYTHNRRCWPPSAALVAVDSAIEVDLTGQADVEVTGGRYVGGTGGAADFLRGAARSEAGTPVLALPSTAGTASRIVARLTAARPGPG